MNANPKYLNLASVLFICILGAVIYSNTLHSPFCFDDVGYIVENASIRNLSNVGAIWNGWPSRFIANLTIAANYHLGKLDVFGYHLFNIFIHLLSAIAVWWLTLITLATPSMKDTKISSHSGLIALFAGLIFVAHPIQTEGVTYVVQRCIPMTTLFYILSISFYAKSRLSQERSVSISCYIMALLTALLAMFTRESSITLPVTIVIYEIFFLKDDRKINWPYLAPFIAMIFIVPVTVISANVIASAKAQISKISLSDYIFTQFRAAATYMRLLVLPFNQNIDYNYPIYKSLLAIPVLFSLALISAIFASAVLLFKRYRLISFAILLSFITLLAESSLISVHSVLFEHRLYLPTVGYSIFLACLVYYILGKRTVRPVIILMVIIIAGYSMLTYNRNATWKDDLTIWNDAVRKSPGKVRSYNNRGLAYQAKGDIDRAISDFTRALEIDPDCCEAYSNRGGAYQSKGDLDRAISDFNKAIKIEPDYFKAYSNRGSAYQSKGDLDRAISDFNKAIKIEPGYFKAYNNRGNAYKDKGDLDRAISDYNKALQVKPDSYEAYYNRGNTYQLKGNIDRAISDYDRALKIDPTCAAAYSNRAIAYFLKNDYNRAWEDVRRAQALGHKVSASFIMKLKQASGKDGP